MSEALLSDWYGWRWSQVFAVSQAVAMPTIPDRFTRILPTDFSIRARLDQVLTDNTECGHQMSDLAPPEVMRLRFVGAGALLSAPSDTWGADHLSIGDLVAALHRVRLKVNQLAERYTPLYGELPEGQYLSNIRTQFLLSHEPSAGPNQIIDFYATACRTLNRLLLAKGSRVQSAISSASRILTAVESLDGVMGILSCDSQTYLALDRSCSAQRIGLDVHAIQKKVNMRIAHRTARDWVQADALQASLNEAGVAISDGEGVTDWWIPYSV